jgi:hypothetical protein
LTTSNVPNVAPFILVRVIEIFSIWGPI